ncbi:MAG: bifunctional diguanylate cyclase/phosphodiesterase [Spirochaetales bacterium]|nr:bifunctional diguanylate cyclase/phosphodiesterase [Spirochaetales bacterium]MDY5916292.1 bifunctional diguanylate cyclase/phosphodiesterase [Treponema sp.]
MDIDFKIILDNIPSPVIVATPKKDDSGKVIDFEISYVNEEVKKAVGYIIKDCRKWSEFENEITSDVPWFKMALDAMAERDYPEAKYFSPSTKKWYKIDMKYLAEQKNVIVFFTDITSERQYYQRLKESAITDVQTGFLNRTGFNESFNIALETARYNKKNTALLILDIDNLQSINDSRGYNEGDALIQGVCEVLKQFENHGVQIFRYGDDEFALIINNFDTEDSLANFIDCIYESFQIKQISVSGGISFFPSNSELSEELIRFADMALQYAKKNGKNNFTYFEPDMQRLFIQKLTLQSKMTTALLENSFSQYYQPQFDINTGKLRGFEALIRWTDAELGNIPPSIFIPIAEETGLIIPIGRWILRTAVKTLKKWQEKYHFDGVMSVNISPIQLLQDNFIEELDEIVRNEKIDPTLLEIEITEGVFIHKMEETVEKLKAIRERGIRVSLDDFGTGYSSLSYLQSLPLNTLKIDKSFINDITSKDGVQANITSSIIKMVGKMGLETIAEGVEYPEQLDLLTHFKCNIVQGFLRGKPMPQKLCDDYLSGDDNALLKNSKG